MCEGTLCTHHIDPVVRFVEESYDLWETSKWTVPTDDESQVWYQGVRNLREIRTPDSPYEHFAPGPGPSHDQPIITIKNDASSYDHLGQAAADERAREWMRCYNCANGVAHLCDYCGRRIACMERGDCAECWNLSDDERNAAIARESSRRLCERLMVSDDYDDPEDTAVQASEPASAAASGRSVVYDVRLSGPSPTISGAPVYILDETGDTPKWRPVPDAEVVHIRTEDDS